MHRKDYYQILGVARNVDPFELKRAFRRLARRYHPDVSSEPNAEERFKAVAAAYDVLRDTRRRAAYDSFGGRGPSGDAFSLPPGWGRQAFDDADLWASFTDVFSDLFAVRHDLRAEDLLGGDEHCELELDLEQAFHGVVETIQVGAPRARRVRVQVPAGVTEGQRLRFAGHGRAGPGGRRGDLFVQLRIRAHRRYRVLGRDIALSVPVTPWEAALGARIRVPTLAGPIEIDMPAATQTGHQLRLAGRGLGHSPKGDQIICFEVHAPPLRCSADRALLETMARQMAFNPRRELFD